MEKVIKYLKSVWTKKNLLISAGIFVLAAIVVLTTDLVVKDWVRRTISTDGSNDSTFLFFKITHIENEGIAFSFFSGSHLAYLIPILIEIVCIVGLIFVNKKIYFICLSAIFFGGLGNIITRLEFGKVTDMFGLTFWPSFAIFNVADMFVDVSAFILCISIITYTIIDVVKDRKNPTVNPDTEQNKKDIEAAYKKELDKIKDKESKIVRKNE